VAASQSTRKYLIVVATTVAAAPPIPRPSSRHTPRSKKPPKITFSVCIQKRSRKVLDLYEDSIRFPLGCLPNVQSVDLTRRRELKPEVCLKIAIVIEFSIGLKQRRPCLAVTVLQCFDGGP